MTTERRANDHGDLFSVAGRHAIVTGATAGIGRRLSETLLRGGARVAVVARRGDKLDELRDEFGDAVVPIVADLSDPGAAQRAADDAIRALGRVDVLVNNAAYIAGGVRAQDESLDEIRMTLNVNLIAPIVLAQAVFPMMQRAGSGSIVNVTSIVGSFGIGRLPQAVYSASKGGLNAITREWATQWSRYGVRVNALAPGFIETEMTSEVVAVPKLNDWILGNTLLPRIGRPSDFDGALLYLASDASLYVTGQILTVDGGWTAH